MTLQQKTTIPNLPVKTPVTNARGNISRQWRTALEGLASSSTPAAARQFALSVPGTLGIRSSAAPLVSLFAGGTASEVTAVVKTAPSGADLVCVVNVDGVAIATVTIANGTTSGTSGAIAAAIASGDGIGLAPGLITLDITAVGSTFPGGDLSVLVNVS